MQSHHLPMFLSILLRMWSYVDSQCCTHLWTGTYVCLSKQVKMLQLHRLMLSKLWMYKINIRMSFQNIYLYSHLPLCLSNHCCTRYYCITYCLSCSYTYGNSSLRMLSSLLAPKPFLRFWFGLLPYSHISWHIQGHFLVLLGSDAVYTDVYKRNNC